MTRTPTHFVNPLRSTYDVRDKFSQLRRLRRAACLRYGLPAPGNNFLFRNTVYLSGPVTGLSKEAAYAKFEEVRNKILQNKPCLGKPSIEFYRDFDFIYGRRPVYGYEVACNLVISPSDYPEVIPTEVLTFLRDLWWAVLPKTSFSEYDAYMVISVILLLCTDTLVEVSPENTYSSYGATCEVILSHELNNNNKKYGSELLISSTANYRERRVKGLLKDYRAFTCFKSNTTLEKYVYMSVLALNRAYVSPIDKLILAVVDKSLTKSLV